MTTTRGGIKKKGRDIEVLMKTVETLDILDNGLKPYTERTSS